MLSTTENTIRDLFNELGNNSVERVKKSQGLCFLAFSTREAAEKALEASSPLLIDDAEVEVVWSKPVDTQIYNTRKTLTKAFTSGISSDLLTEMELWSGEFIQDAGEQLGSEVLLLLGQLLQSSWCRNMLP